MSGSVDDEARARLDVAQLYEEMGQLPKAVRYYLEAAQIYKDGGVAGKHRELITKVLEMDPENEAAKLEMTRLARPPAPSPQSTAPAPAPAPPTPPNPGVAPKAQTTGLPPLQLPQPKPGKVLVPTPWLFRDPRVVAKAKAEIKPVEQSQLAFDPLPSVDPQMVMLKQEQRRKQEEEAARKANPRVESAFASRPSAFGGGQGGSLFAKKDPAPTPPTAPAAAPAPPAAQPASRFGMGGRGGNQDLAEQIRRRMLEKGK